MKALLLCPELYATEGGIPRMSRLYLRALIEDRSYRQISLIVLNDSQLPAKRVTTDESATRVKAFSAGGGRLRFVLRTLGEARAARRLICGHLHLLPVARLAQLLNPRLAIYLVAHGIEIDRPIGFLLRWALRGTTRIWCVSADTRARLLTRQPDLPASRMLVLPNAFEPTLISPPSPPGSVAEKPATDAFILTVSRLDRRESYKGIDQLIAAFATVHVSEPRVRLRIVGGGDDLDRLRALVRERELDAWVDFTGTVDDTQLKSEFASCRIFALPSTREGFGLVFIEAMAHGKPCVGVRAGGVPEIISGESGRLAQPNDIPLLAAVLIEALRHDWDPELIRAHAARYSFGEFQQRLAAAY